MKSRKPPKRRGEKKPLVSVVMGSDSDLPLMQEAAHALREFGVPHEVSIVSAHRTPWEMVQFAERARKRGIKVIIAGAGGAAQLPGMIASLTELPVVGVPVPVGHLKGEDALLSIVQMPKGVPVATVAIGTAWNAGILAAQIIGASGDPKLLDKIAAYKQGLRKMVLRKRARLKR